MRDTVLMLSTWTLLNVLTRRLLAKCEGMGITGSLLVWIKNWLTRRKQRVVKNGQASSWGDVLSGVPQVAVLSTVRFLIYISTTLTLYWRTLLPISTSLPMTAKLLQWWRLRKTETSSKESSPGSTSGAIGGL